MTGPASPPGCEDRSALRIAGIKRAGENLTLCGSQCSIGADGARTSCPPERAARTISSDSFAKSERASPTGGQDVRDPLSFLCFLIVTTRKLMLVSARIWATVAG